MFFLRVVPFSLLNNVLYVLVPSPPQNIGYTEHTPGVIVLRWTPPAHTNGVIIAYIIKYRRADPDLTWDIIRENGKILVFVM